MIKAIAFDLGGVIFSFGSPLYYKKLDKLDKRKKEYVYRLLESDLSVDLRRGKVSEKDFWAEAKKTMPSDLDVDQIEKEWYECYQIDKNLIDLIIRLKEKYKIFAFSLNTKGRVEYLEKKYAFRKLFDKEIYSFDCGFIKPEKEFVECLIEGVDVEPSEIVYVDDKPEDASVAKHYGIKVLIHEYGNIDRLVKDLKRFGVEV